MLPARLPGLCARPLAPDMHLPDSIARWLKPSTWNYAAQRLDFGLVLPLIARLPLRWAYRVSNWRGAINARFARDWTELSVGSPFMGSRCAAAYRELFPQASDTEIQKLVVQRYQTTTREELVAVLAIQGRLDKIDWDMDSFRQALAQRQAGRGLVVVVSHFDNFFLGMIGIARCGQPVHTMKSDIVQDPRVHPTLRKFFHVKYQRYEEAMGGVPFLTYGAAARDAFHRVLNQGGIVVMASDGPASQGEHKGTWVSWMGKQRKMADGAVRMAIDTGSQIVGMRSPYAKLGRVVAQWSEMIDPQDFHMHDPVRTRELIYAPIFAFLESGIRADPGLWWASHLLGDFEVRDEQV